MVINVDQCWSMYIGFSLIFVDFEVPGNRKVMKIRGKVDRRGKGRLGAQKNEANRVKETPERAPETSMEWWRERQKSPDYHRRDCEASNFGGPGPALSILLRKIQRTKNRRD